MSRTLAKLLDQPEEAVSKIINRLEAKNGYPSHDVRQSAEIIPQIRTRISQLGLDPDDTTTEELRQALLVKFENDGRRFDEHFGLHGQNYDQKIKKAVELVSKNVDLPDRWVLKKTAAKQLLRQHAPKKVMKELHYRSVASLVKRENLAEIYLAVELIESPAWNKTHFNLASHLETTAFERRPLELAALTGRWNLSQTDNPLVGSGDYGACGLVPTAEISKMNLLSLVVLLLDEAGAKPSAAATLSPAAAWWVETDGLLADIGEEPVTLNLKDMCLSRAADELDRSNARKYFWKELLGRYENQLLNYEDSLPELELPALKMSPPVSQPAFEYVEDI